MCTSIDRDKEVLGCDNVPSFLCPAKGFAVFVFHVVRHDKVWKKISGTSSKHFETLRSKIVSNTRSVVSRPWGVDHLYI